MLKYHEEIKLFIKLVYTIKIGLMLIMNYLPDQIKLITHYGKTREKLKGLEGVTTKEDNTIFHKLINFGLNLTINKSSFKYYYIYSISLTIILNFYLFFTTSIPFNFNYFLFSFLLPFHFTRRVYECLYIQKLSSKVQMHMIVFILGLMHYTCFILACFLKLIESNEGEITFNTGSVSSPLLLIMQNFLILLFFYSNYQQYHCHYCLSNLKTSSSSAYELPNISYFRNSIAPHYFFEIIIYTCFMILFGSTMELMFCLLFVGMNLSITAGLTKEWYVKQFPKQKEEIINRNLLLPYRLGRVNSNKQK